MILKEIYIGGGNEGRVLKNTFVNIKNAKVKGSVYAGGNGATAIVSENTNININNGTIIGDDNSKVPAQGSVFGGGNAAATGEKNTNQSVATVNVVGGEIFGNLYRWCKYFSCIW